MAKNYVVAIILEGQDKDLKRTLKESGVEVDNFADKAESGGQRIQQALTGAAIAMTFGKSIPLMRKAIEMYAEAESAQTSLGTAAKYAGTSFDDALVFLQDYTQDGLIPVAQASLALKNLLLAGYGLERSKEMLLALKDFAAYGRQGQLSMGEAVQRATEGLKNQMSQLVDNAGLTKNLAVMYREYAQSVGKGAGSLTEEEKITAIYLGTMKEWPAVHGDASRASDQLVGDMARQEARTRTLYEALGKGLEPAYRQMLKPLGDVTDAITAFAKANPEATATLLGGAGLVAAVGALAAAFALMGPAGAIVVGVSAAVVGIAALVAKFRAEQAGLTEKLRDTAVTARDQADEIRGLWNEYKELSKHTEPTKEDQERIDEIGIALASSIPGVTTALLDQKGAWEGAEEAVGSYLGTLETISQAALNTLKVQRQRILNELGIAEKAYEDFAETVYPKAEDIPEGMTFEDFFGGVSLKEQMKLEELNAPILRLREEFKRVQEAIDAVSGTAAEMEAAIKTGSGGAGEAVEQTTVGISDANAALQHFIVLWEKLTGLDFPDTAAEGFELLLNLMHSVGSTTEDAEKKVSSLERKLKQATRGWGDMEQFGVNAAVGVTSAFGSSLAAILKNTGDTSEQLREIWNSFFDWMIEAIAQMVAQWAALKILQAIFPGFSLFGAEGGQVKRAAGGGMVARAAGGGVFRGPVAGFDRVPVLAQIDEAFLSTDLTRRIDRMVGDYESGRSASAVAAPAPSFAVAGPGNEGTTVYQIYALDANSVTEQIRRGTLGRELRDAQLYGQFKG